MDNQLANKIYEAFNDDSDDPIEIIEDGEWEVEHKRQVKESIVKFKGKYYSITESRSGSYYSDYFYDEPTIVEVEPKTETVVITKWVAKK